MAKQNMTPKQIRTEIARLEAENAGLLSRLMGNIRVSEKGGVSVYGLGKWPVTLYKEQWIKLLAMAEAILQFIKMNEAQLSTKDAPKIPAPAQFVDRKGHPVHPGTSLVNASKRLRKLGPMPGRRSA